MITAKQAMENPELMIKHKASLKNIKIFKEPWYGVFQKYPYLYREFSDRVDETGGWDISCALRDNPTMILDLKDHLYKLDKMNVGWILYYHPELSLCMKYRNDLDKFEAAYYILFPNKLDDLNREEKREMSKRIMEILREEKV